MKRIYLVLGAESSGTRVVTDMLIKAGCNGDSSHKQYFDNNEFSGDKCVFRRSVPHKQKTPCFGNIERRIQSQGYEPLVIVTKRSWYAMLRSQILRAHILDKKVSTALERTKKAYLDIYEFVRSAGYDYREFYIEEAIKEEKYYKHFLSSIGLKPIRYDFIEINKKHYCNAK
jgi:hypothetical protein